MSWFWIVASCFCAALLLAWVWNRRRSSLSRSLAKGLVRAVAPAPGQEPVRNHTPGADIVVVDIDPGPTELLATTLDRHGVAADRSLSFELTEAHGDKVWVVPVATQRESLMRAMEAWIRSFDERTRRIAPPAIVFVWFISRVESTRLARRVPAGETTTRNDSWLFTGRAWGRLLDSANGDSAAALNAMTQAMRGILNDAGGPLGALRDRFRDSSSEIEFTAWIPVRQSLAPREEAGAWRLATSRAVLGPLVEFLELHQQRQVFSATPE